MSTATRKELEQREKELQEKCAAAFKVFRSAQDIADEKREIYRAAKDELGNCQVEQTQLLVAKLRTEGRL